MNNLKNKTIVVLLSLLCILIGYSQQREAKDFIEEAKEGVPEAQFNLALCYARGNGVEQSYSKAAYWYERAAMKGNDRAQFNLALSYYEGKGVEQSYSQAAYWLQKAANQNHPEAQCNLAILYYTGKGVTKNKSLAIYWAQESCKNFNDKGCSFLNNIK